MSRVASELAAAGWRLEARDHRQRLRVSLPRASPTASTASASSSAASARADRHRTATSSACSRRSSRSAGDPPSPARSSPSSPPSPRPRATTCATTTSTAPTPAASPKAESPARSSTVPQDEAEMSERRYISGSGQPSARAAETASAAMAARMVSTRIHGVPPVVGFRTPEDTEPGPRIPGGRGSSARRGGNPGAARLVDCAGELETERGQFESAVGAAGREPLLEQPWSRPSRGSKR